MFRVGHTKNTAKHDEHERTSVFLGVPNGRKAAASVRTGRASGHARTNEPQEKSDAVSTLQAEMDKLQARELAFFFLRPTSDPRVRLVDGKM